MMSVTVVMKLTIVSCLDGGMMTMLELLPLVTLALTLVSSPSHGSLQHSQHGTLNDLLVDQEDMQLPAEVRELLLNVSHQ